MELWEQMLSEEDILLRRTMRELVRREIAPRARQVDESEKFPREGFSKLAENGFLGLLIPEEYGGTGSSELSYVLATEEIAKACAATATVYVTQYHGALGLLLAGNEEQKHRYLPDLAHGKKVGAIALTEPEAGSDVAAIRTRAGKKGNHYVLNGTKTFITQGDEADLVTVIARTDPGLKHKGLSAFVIEKGFAGFSTGPREPKMGIRGSSAVELHFEDCRVPEENLLGQAGEGFAIAMKFGDRSRVSAAALALGIAQGAFDIAFRYARERKQFDQAIYNFQGVGFMLADMFTGISAARVLLYQLARLIDAGHKDTTLDVSIAKLLCSDTAMKVTTDAVQILGGYGYSREYGVERMMRDAKVTQIFEGTNQIQRLIIARNLVRRLG